MKLRQMILLPEPKRMLWLFPLILLGFWYSMYFVKCRVSQSEGFLAAVADKAWRGITTGEQEVNLAFVVYKNTYIRQFYTLVKNIMYYQGRSIREDEDCKLEIKTLQNFQCPRLIPLGRMRTIHFHILAPEEVKSNVAEYFKEGDFQKIRITFYDWRLALSMTNRTGSRLVWDDILTLKMLWPEILGPSVKKVITLDTDLVINQNIEKLWKIFDEFRDEQIIGGVFEQWDFLQRHSSAKVFPILKSGMNSGVVLLHLEKIRLSNWTKWWREIEMEMKSKLPKIPAADQGIINAILYRKPELLHEISCEWNYTPNGKHFKDYCPVAYVVRVPSRSDCFPLQRIGNQTLRLASIVHLAGRMKQEAILRRGYHGNPSPVKEFREFDDREVEHTFMEVYVAFRKIKENCFSVK